MQTRWDSLNLAQSLVFKTAVHKKILRPVGGTGSVAAGDPQEDAVF